MSEDKYYIIIAAIFVVGLILIVWGATDAATQRHEKEMRSVCDSVGMQLINNTCKPVVVPCPSVKP